MNQVLESTELTQNISSSGIQLEKMVMNQVNSTNDVVIQAQSISNTSKYLVQTVNQMEIAFRDLQNSSHSVSEKLQSISQEAEKINFIVQTITDIADRTKMLSINASLEASRVGIHGQGFAVIAEEIGKLTDETTEAANQINQMVGEMRSVVSTGVKKMNTFTDKHIETFTYRIEEIDQGIQAQVESAEDIKSGIENLSQSSNQTANYLQSNLDNTNHNLEQLNQAVENLRYEFKSSILKKSNYSKLTVLDR